MAAPKPLLKLAIYSGEIPSTTFIERLVCGISQKPCRILLFGVLKSKPSYSKNVKILGYRSHRLFKLLYLLKYTVLLVVFKQQEKRQLDAVLRAKGKSNLYSKVKYYPVLYHRPDVFHVQWAKGIADWMWVQEFGMKLVLSLRGAHINYSPIADQALAVTYRQCFPKVDGFHAVSNAIAKEASNYHAPLSQIRIVKSGLPLNEFPFQIKDFRPHAGLKIVSVGRNHWIKHYQLALDAMGILKQWGTQFQYHLVGVWHDEALCFQRDQLDLKTDVHFSAALSYHAVKTVIQQADVLLLPSLEEGIANVVLEAMALGTLVVSTDCGGMSEIIRHGENGFLVPIRDPKAMAQAILEIAQLTGEDIQKITNQARLDIENNHNSKKMVNDMEHLYQQVLN